MNSYMKPVLALTLFAAFAACGPGMPGSDAADVPDAQPDTGCPQLDIVDPQASAVLGPNDDVSGQRCMMGFRYNVRVATNAPQGTRVELVRDGTVVATESVAGPVVTFSNVAFDSTATPQLVARIAGGTMACTSGTVSFSVACGTPTCRVTEPARMALNRNDDVSTNPMTFAARFTVETNVETGQNVTLFVSSPMGTPPQMLTAQAMGGRAIFPSVTLSPDGEHRVRAECPNRAGTVGRSAETAYTVDSVPPVLAIQSPAAMSVVPFDTDVNMMATGRQFRVCGRSDAAGQQVCARVMGGAPDMPAGCATVPMSADQDACVEVTCPSGSAPFDVEMFVSDRAGNQRVVSLAGISCASSLPSVRIVDPVGYTMGMPGTVLNRARDLDATAEGLQYNVVVCTDVMSGTARLRSGMTDIGEPATIAPSVMGDPCAMAGLTGIARFNRVTIPDSSPARRTPSDPEPTNPVLTATVMAPTGTGTSPGVLLYVDALAPVPSIIMPTCGSVLRPAGSDTDVVTNVDVQSDALPVTLTYEQPGGMRFMATANAYDNAVARVVRFPNVRLAAGQWVLRASATDPAGNSGATANCPITVGNPPSVMFVSPGDRDVLNAMGDATPGTPGYQGATIRVQTNAPTGTVVTLTINGGSPVMSTVGAGGVVTFGPLTLPEGDAVVLEAVTADVPGRGVGRASISIRVDTQAPGAPTALMATVANRRAGTLSLTFANASDPGTPARAVARYEIRVSATGALTDANFAMGTAVTYGGTPGMPGTPEMVQVTGLQLGRSYHVGVRAVDAAGNVSPVVSVGPVALDISVLRIVEPTVMGLGTVVSGGYDVNNDSIPDVVVGSTAGEVRIYFGSRAGSGITSANFTRISGSAGGGFGRSVASLGDFDGDGIGDILIGEPGGTLAAPGTAYIFLGRNGTTRRWPGPTDPALSAANADVVITNTGAPEFATSNLGLTVARVGDFNGDGRADALLGAPFANNGTVLRAGAAFVVLGRAVSAPVTINAPTEAPLVVRGETQDDVVGIRVAGVGRVLGADMLEDAAISSRGTMSAGNVYLFAGRALPMRSTLNVSAATASRIGTTPMASENIAAGVGDINGDGRADVAVGASGGFGYVQLHFGDAMGGLTVGPRITNPGGSGSDNFGISVAQIVQPTQVRPSLLFGTPTAADLGVGSTRYIGAAPVLSLFAGRPSWTGVTAQTADARLTAALRGMVSVQPVSTANWAGDVNGDMFPDLVFGQPNAEGSVWLAY